MSNRLYLDSNGDIVRGDELGDDSLTEIVSSGDDELTEIVSSGHDLSGNKGDLQKVLANTRRSRRLPKMPSRYALGQFVGDEDRVQAEECGYNSHLAYVKGSPLISALVRKKLAEAKRNKQTGRGRRHAF